MVVTVTKGWYVQQGDQWFVRLETETENISQEAHYHGDYYYLTVVLDGLPQGERTCFSLTGGEISSTPHSTTSARWSSSLTAIRPANHCFCS